MKLLLASRSSTRRGMLEAAGVLFDSVASPIDEEEVKARLRSRGLQASDLARQLADSKALAVAAPAGVLVLGADQLLECEDGSTLDKARSREESFAQLRALAGRPHRLHSAAAIAERGSVVWRSTETVTLQVRPLSDEFLHCYLDAEYDVIRHNVGGYRIEGPGVQLFDRIDGNHFAILGLPLLPLLSYLRARGVIER